MIVAPLSGELVKCPFLFAHPNFEMQGHAFPGFMIDYGKPTHREWLKKLMFAWDSLGGSVH